MTKSRLCGSLSGSQDTVEELKKTCCMGVRDAREFDCLNRGSSQERRNGKSRVEIGCGYLARKKVAIYLNFSEL